MRVFRLRIDLSRGTTLDESGFEKGIEIEDGPRLIVQSRFEGESHIFYLAGICFSFKNQLEIEEWMGRFSPEQIGDWAKSIDGDVSIAVLDKKNRKTYLVSDRNGAMRVYYSNQAGYLCISNSHLELIRLISNPRLSSFAAYQLLTMKWVLDPYCLIEGAGTTMPGQVITFEANRSTVFNYYSPVQMDVDYFRTEKECVRALDSANHEVFQKRYSRGRESCVLLSGGIDSLAALKYAGEAAQGRVHTLTFSVKGLHSQDLVAARIAAKHSGSLHHELIIDPAAAVKLWVRCLKEADTSNYSALFTLAARDFLETQGAKFDVISGDDTRLHTPSFDYPKELGIFVNRAELRNSTLLRVFLSMGSKFQKVWPFIGKNYLRYWLDHLTPAESFDTYVLESLMGYQAAEGCNGKKNEYSTQLIEEIPQFDPHDGMQQIFKKCISFQHRSQNSDDMNCTMSSLTGPSTEVHLPFYDWQSVSVSNRIPYHLGMRPKFTVRSWDGIPLVRKRILRTMLKDFAPKELLYRAKATVSSLNILFNSQLRDLIDLLLKRWCKDLLDSVDSQVAAIIKSLVKSYFARNVFDAKDEHLLWAIMQVSYLSVLNQVIRDSSFKLADELEWLDEFSLSGWDPERRAPSVSWK